jgi:hypothetical protein
MMGREVVVVVTNSRLDDSTELAEVLGTWERIFKARRMAGPGVLTAGGESGC